ncbi:nucleotide disphospho-sugar-binding domain-containing protein [Micromonospora sp. NPDC051196]|uniref:nucleotide disphospho-sugar-binding domain-containing protein n=1 Tax=Micromonospora sp. NPDC051196 TaxID=3155281 RepID=UPI00344069BC
MRILFVTCPSKTHLYAMAPLAWALKTAGHEVQVASQIDSVNFSADHIAHTGLPAVPLGNDLDVSTSIAAAIAASEASSPPPPAPAEPGRRQTQREYAAEDPYAELDSLAREHFTFFNSDPLIDGAVRYARRWRPDLVIWDGMTMAYAGPVAARAAGAAHARFVFGPDSVAQLRAAVPDRDPLRDVVQPILERYGLAYDEQTLTGHWSINAMPPWIWYPPGMHYLWMRPSPFNGPSVVPDWVLDERERRRVCITLGLSFRDLDAGASAGALLEAVADLDAEVIVTLSRDQVAALPGLPANVRAVDFVPLTALLPTCSAVVHHGGYGTFVSALEHGVPQLMVPGKFGNDKFWGPLAYLDYMEPQGAGLYVSEPDQLTPDVLRDKLLRVLKEPAFGRNAARLRAQSDELPTPNEVVPIIERLTARYRP